VSASGSGTFTLSGSTSPSSLYIDAGCTLTGGTNSSDQTVLSGATLDSTTTGDLFIDDSSDVAGDATGVTDFQIRDGSTVTAATLPNAFVELGESGQLTLTSSDAAIGILSGSDSSNLSASGTLTITGAYGAIFTGNISDGSSALSVVVNGSQVLLGTQSYTGSTTVNGTLGVTASPNNLAIADGGTVQALADTTLSSGFTIPDDPAAVASIDTNGFNVTVSATVSGTGQLRATGPGTLNLTGSIAASTLVADGGVTAVIANPASVPDGINLSVGDTDALATLDDSLLLTRVTTTEGDSTPPPPFDYARAHAIYEGRRDVSVDVIMAEAAVYNPTNPDTTAAVMSAINVDFNAAMTMLAENNNTRVGMTQAAVDSAMAGAWATAGKTAVSNSNTWDGGVANPYDDPVIAWRNQELQFMETSTIS